MNRRITLTLAAAALLTSSCARTPSDPVIPSESPTSGAVVIPSESQTAPKISTGPDRPGKPARSPAASSVIPTESPGLDGPPGAVKHPDAVAVARAWASAAHTIGWRDPSPTAWIDRAARYSTPALQARQNRLRDGGGGTTWDLIQREHCTTGLQGLGAGADDVAGAVLVYVSAQLATNCTTGTVHLTPLRLKLRMSRTATAWLVDEITHY